MWLFDVLQAHYNNELWDEVIFCYNIALDRRLGGDKNEALGQVYLADSYFYCGNYSEAKRLYYNSLKLYKGLARPITLKGLGEVEVRYRLHQCLNKVGKLDEALAVLAAIPVENSPPKVKYALYRLSLQLNSANSENIISRLQDIVSSCPTVFRCTVELLKLGNAKAITKQSIEEAEDDGVRGYLEAVATSSTEPFKAAEQLSRLPNCYSPTLRIEMGRLYNLVGLRTQAREQLWKAFQMDNDTTDGMGLLAALLAKEEDVKSLETLAINLMERNESSVEAWVAFGYLTKSQNKMDRALHFAFKATTMNKGRVNSDAMLLKAQILIDKDNIENAAQHLEELLVEDPRNIDAYEALVSLYISNARTSEAAGVVTRCGDVFGRPMPARIKMLDAAVRLKDDSNSKEARLILESIVEGHPYLADAVFMLIDLYKDSNAPQKGIDLCNSIINSCLLDSNLISKIHQSLGDFQKMASAIELSAKYACDAHISFNKAMTMGSLESQQKLVALDSALRYVHSPENVIPTISRISEAPGAPRARRRQRSPRSSPPPTLAPRLQFS
ncbi:unnamed protein product, partial [Mesorhabditis belari]|uniref:Uncharacterized protein n=1 Tax=Mesorhabditis belari TaxID=2138241 RepID=A0AAF3FHW0_9BILA